MTNPAFTIGDAVIYAGSNLDILPTLPDNSVDSIVTDPPYELGFMGKSWDSSGIAYSVELWQECLRVLKPGGHLLAFSGSRTYHRMTVAIEDAGFEIRDMISWVSNKTFPKSHNIALAIDKAAGVQNNRGARLSVAGNINQGEDVTYPAGIETYEQITDNAKKWTGWGTALKPTVEPVVMARKPVEGTIADNVVKYGVGGLNIDASRIETNDDLSGGSYGGTFGASRNEDGSLPKAIGSGDKGRWPANIVLDEHAATIIDEQASDASRFFYVARASKADRNEGLDELPVQMSRKFAQDETTLATMPFGKQPVANFHPTVKPTDLMRYLIKLVTPAGGVVLDPFTGSGSTGKAAILDHYQFIGIELTPEYLPIIQGRLEWAQQQANQPQPETLF
jgi:site-specific DNA-methyltransferase (adenine-specific)